MVGRFRRTGHPLLNSFQHGMQPETIFIRSVVISFAPKARKANTMQLLQNLKRKSVARHATTLLAALALGTAVTTAALAAGHGGGGGGGGGHMGGGGGGHIGGGGGFGGGHFARGGFGGRMSGGFHDGDHFGGGLRDGDHRFGGEVHGRDRRFGERFGGGGFAYAPGYDDYGYDGLSDFTGDGACYQYREVYTTAGWQWRQLWVCN
jgi:hypothetical protein